MAESSTNRTVLACGENITLRVAQYLRSSTKDQSESTCRQAEMIGQYALDHCMQIVRSYVDDGCSGLDLKGRPALRELLSDILHGRFDFEALLVSDISRWGRFQDPDESAYYEFLCRRAGVQLVYCAEPFDNDGSVLGDLAKAMKRTMAGEYSRELSIRVSLGKRRLAQSGFHHGAYHGLGLRRKLVDANGVFKAWLGPGERKRHPTDRVVLAPGAPGEVALVQRMFYLFAKEGMTDRGIACLLNREGVSSVRGRPWRPCAVTKILTNERYVGTLVFNRTSVPLNCTRIYYAPELWTRCAGAWEGIVDADLFEAAQAARRDRLGRIPDSDLLDTLKALLSQEGELSVKLINQLPLRRRAAAYRKRFGSIREAYAKIGYAPLIKRCRRQENPH